MRITNTYLITLLITISQTFCALRIMAWSRSCSIYLVNISMCLNQRWINNPYSGQRIYVKCGTCPACLHEKAAKRVVRLENSRVAGDGLVCMFASCTYTNKTIPYFNRSEYQNFIDGISDRFYIYRDSRLTNHGLINEREILKTVFLSDFDEKERYVFKSIDNFKGLRYKENGVFKEDSERVGVSLYIDAQNFIKRLKQRLSRVYKYTRKWNYFVCSEYGETYCRPHFHLLFYVSKGDESIFQRAFFEVWPFHDISKIDSEDVWQYARKPSKYVASYVNCTSYVPQLFLTKLFRPKSRFSYGLGFSNKLFSYDEVSEKIGERNLRYDKNVIIDGCVTSLRVPLPKYVINKYFYKFKGFANLTTYEVYDLILSCGSAVPKYAKKLGLNVFCTKNLDVVHHDEISALERFLIHKCNKFGRTFSELERYAYNYSHVWNIYASNCQIDSYDVYEKLPERDKIEFYYNIVDYFDNKIRSPTLDYLGEVYFDCQKDFNFSGQNLLSHNIALGEFYKHDKSRKLNSRFYNL